MVGMRFWPPNNAALVAQAHAGLRLMGRQAATAIQVRAWFDLV